MVDEDAPSLSNHKYIRYEIGRYIPCKTHYRNLRKADFEKFRPNFECNCSIDSPPVIDSAAIAFKWDIDEAIDICCPLKPALNRHPVDWWSPKLDELRRKVKKALLRVNIRGGGKRQIKTRNYLELLHSYWQEIFRSKKESWQRFRSEAESSKGISSLVSWQFRSARPSNLTGRFGSVWQGPFHNCGSSKTPSTLPSPPRHPGGRPSNARHGKVKSIILKCILLGNPKLKAAVVRSGPNHVDRCQDQSMKN